MDTLMSTSPTTVNRLADTCYMHTLHWPSSSRIPRGQIVEHAVNLFLKAGYGFFWQFASSQLADTAFVLFVLIF